MADAMLPRREIPAPPLEPWERSWYGKRGIRICRSCNLPEGSWLHAPLRESADEFACRWWERDAHGMDEPVRALR